MRWVRAVSPLVTRLPWTAIVLWAFVGPTAFEWNEWAGFCVLVVAVAVVGIWVWRHHGAARWARMASYLAIFVGGHPAGWTPEMVRTLLNLGWNLRPLALRAGFDGDLRKIGAGDGFAHEIPRVVKAIPVGRRVSIRILMPPGMSAGALINAPDEVAAALRVPVAQLECRVGEDAAVAEVAAAFGADPLRRRFEIGGMPGMSGATAPVPVAVDENMQIVSLAQAHTLFIAATGAGKGSMIWAMVASFRSLGSDLVDFWGFDSKASEVKAGEKLFSHVAYTPEDHVANLEALRQELDLRGEVSSSREFVASSDMPLIVVVIDEITSLESIFSDSKQKNAAMGNLRVILSLGRSRGILVVGAGQDPTKDALKLRNLFPQVVAGRLRDATETRLVLGDGAVEEGAMPHRIGVASRSNSYATAGIAFIRTESGEIVRCRFPFTSDEDLAAWGASSGESGEGADDAGGLTWAAVDKDREVSAS